MSQFVQLTWQDIVVWLVLGLVIFALLYYIGRRLQSLKNITHKNLENCTSCQNCSHSAQTCAKAENQRELEELNENNFPAPDG